MIFSSEAVPEYIVHRYFLQVLALLNLLVPGLTYFKITRLQHSIFYNSTLVCQVCVSDQDQVKLKEPFLYVIRHAHL